MPKLTSKPFRVAPSRMERQDQRFDLILRGVRHIGCSYEGRIFLNNTAADETTKQTHKNGYAGSFFVFGKGDCYGAAGHCGPPGPQLPYDDTPPPASLPIEVHVDITSALLRTAKASDEKDITLTIVPIANHTAPHLEVDEDHLMEISGRISIVAYA